MAEAAFVIRRATTSDIGAIAALVNELSGLGQLLPRTAEDIQNSIDWWRVALIEDQFMGCGSLVPYSKSRAEVRSLAVAEAARGNGLGGELLSALIAEAKASDFETLFALTRAIPVFVARGFRVGKRAQFPEKVWRDCLACPLLLDCDETTVVLDLRPGEANRRIPRRD
jgi:amino-acid N-acetyltransferase